jgi:hypothetical protein
MHDMTSRGWGGMHADSPTGFAEADPTNPMTPGAILADQTLTRDEKLRRLRAWASTLTNGTGMSPENVMLRFALSAIADIERQQDERSAQPWPSRLQSRTGG